MDGLIVPGNAPIVPIVPFVSINPSSHRRLRIPLQLLLLPTPILHSHLHLPTVPDFTRLGIVQLTLTPAGKRTIGEGECLSSGVMNALRACPSHHMIAGIQGPITSAHHGSWGKRDSNHPFTCVCLHRTSAIADYRAVIHQSCVFFLIISFNFILLSNLDVPYLSSRRLFHFILPS